MGAGLIFVRRACEVAGQLSIRHLTATRKRFYTMATAYGAHVGQGLAAASYAGLCGGLVGDNSAVFH